MAEPILITLDPVFFEEGKLWRPRYPSLIDHGHAPASLQFEPAFQAFAESLKVTFQIAAGQDAVFDAIGEAVRFERLTPAGQPVAEVSVTLGESPRECHVQWTRKPGVRLTSLRIVCVHETGGPDPETDAWARTQVEGGVYLVILDGGVLRAFPDTVRKPEERDPREDRQGKGRVQVVGINEANGRPIYDLFRADFSLPPELAPEPAFRTSHGESIDFPLALDLPPDLHDVCFKTDGQGQVDMSYAVPALRPESLLGSPAGEEDRLCTVEWHHAPLTSCVTGSPEAGTVVCRQGRTANLYAQVDPGPLRAWPIVSVDPTVIEPPACDANGVCTKPRDRVEE